MVFFHGYRNQSSLFLALSHHLSPLALFSSWIITYREDDRSLVVSSGDLLTTELLSSSLSPPLSSPTPFRPVVPKLVCTVEAPREIQKLLMPPPTPKIVI